MPAIMKNVFSELVYKQREEERTDYFPWLRALHTRKSIYTYSGVF